MRGGGISDDKKLKREEKHKRRNQNIILCHLHICIVQKIIALQNRFLPGVGPKSFCRWYISVLWLFLVFLHTTLVWLCSGVLTNCCHYLAMLWCSRQHLQ